MDNDISTLLNEGKNIDEIIRLLNCTLNDINTVISKNAYARGYLIGLSKNHGGLYAQGYAQCMVDVLHTIAEKNSISIHDAEQLVMRYKEEDI